MFVFLVLMTTTPIPTTTTLEPENYIIFGGSNWILYDNKGLSTDQLQKNNYEQFMIEFKASDPNGLLWWAGTEDRNIHLSLKVRGDSWGVGTGTRQAS